MQRRILSIWLFLLASATQCDAELMAGTARVDISDPTGQRNDPSFARVLVLKDGDQQAMLLTLDVVSIGEIGRIGNSFLKQLRSDLEVQLGIPPHQVIVNASHCHAVVRADFEPMVLQAVAQALKRLEPVTTATAIGREDRISENRRLFMHDDTQVDMRRAYSMPTDKEVKAVGPIDPTIGILKLSRSNGTALAVLYQFACHPIMNPPSKGSSADYPGVASKVIEDALGNDVMAFFLQGCGGDINPIRYKEISTPPSAEPLGTMLGASLLRALATSASKPTSVLRVSNETISLPRANDYAKRIAIIESQQKQTLASLKPTNISFKSFLPLVIQQKLFPDFPSHYSQSYLHDLSLERDSIEKLDADNRASVEAYMDNIAKMEKLTRLNTNLALLKKHQAETIAAGESTLDVEVCGLRVGDFKLVTFPGELTVQVGLNIKTASKDPFAFVSGYTNGYIYYTPTVEQRRNTGFAQEDCDTLVAPEWQAIFEAKALDVLRKLAE